jgi:hypothetical protein
VTAPPFAAGGTNSAFSTKPDPASDTDIVFGIVASRNT